MNLATGETKFTDSYDEFLTFKAEYEQLLRDPVRPVLTRPSMQCGVLGDPIAHSLSPVLHRAGYVACGLDWEYDAHRVPAGGLAGFVDGLDASWRGLSVTAPLKREAADRADSVTATVALAGVANTLVRDGRWLAGRQHRRAGRGARRYASGGTAR